MLATLHAAGGDVPRPVAVARNAMLIEFIGHDGRAAPQLRDVRLSPGEAEELLEQALRNIEIMLSCHVVHGDLSAYNMLHTQQGLMIIDFPQAIDPRTNRNARSLLARDVANVCAYFASQGADATPGTYADELWDLYMRAELSGPAVFKGQCPLSFAPNSSLTFDRIDDGERRHAGRRQIPATAALRYR